MCCDSATVYNNHIPSPHTFVRTFSPHSNSHLSWSSTVYLSRRREARPHFFLVKYTKKLCTGLLQISILGSCNSCCSRCSISGFQTFYQPKTYKKRRRLSPPHTTTLCNVCLCLWQQTWKSLPMAFKRGCSVLRRSKRSLSNIISIWLRPETTATPSPYVIYIKFPFREWVFAKRTEIFFSQWVVSLRYGPRIITC